MFSETSMNAAKGIKLITYAFGAAFAARINHKMRFIQPTLIISSNQQHGNKQKRSQPQLAPFLIIFYRNIKNHRVNEIAMSTRISPIRNRVIDASTKRILPITLFALPLFLA
jgi:hypothetical protein